MLPELKLRSRALQTAGAALLLAVTTAAPAVAQEKMGGQKFRTSLGATLLVPVQSHKMLMDSVRLPSGRAVLEIQANPTFGFHFGGLRLAPNAIYADTVDPTLAANYVPQYQWALNAGILGFRLNFTTGRVRFAPFVDGGVGMGQVRIDDGNGYFGAGGRYQPGTFTDTSSLMVGGGGGAALDVILGPGLTLALVGGYWHFLPLTMNEETGEPIVDPLSGAFGGAGLKLAFSSESYYWRHSGKDKEPPVLAIMNPTPDDDGVVNVGQASTTLSLRAADRSQIDSVFVNGQKVRLVPIPGKSEDGFAFNASAPLSLHPGPNQVRYMAFDGAGNRLEGTWEIHGIPLDKEGPRIAFVQPQDGLSISTDKLLVEAIIADRSPIEQVTLGGLTLRTVEGSAADRERVEAAANDFVVKIQSTTTIPDAQYDITVAAVDSASNTSISKVTVHRADLTQVAQAQPQPQPQPQQVQAQPAARSPQIEIFSPTEWAGAGTRGFAAQPKASIRVEGQVSYDQPITEVRVNNARMSLQAASGNPGLVKFSGFVTPPPAGSNGEVEIQAIGSDGRQAVRKYTVQTQTQELNGVARANEILSAASKRQRWAVVVGVSDYLDPNITDLNYADDDAQAVYDFLLSPSAGLGGFEPDHVQLLLNENATARNIRSALTTFLRQSTPDDVIFIYIAGHGAPDQYRPDDLYILAHDTELADIAATGVPMEDVNDAIRSAYAYNKVLVTDACHSAGVGAGTRAGSNNQINAHFLDYMNNSSGGFVAFTASAANQLSQEGEKYGGGHGVFTYFFLEGLNGAADEDSDGVVTLVESMLYTQDKVRRETRNNQIPQMSLTAYDGFWPMAAVLDGNEGAGSQ